MTRLYFKSLAYGLMLTAFPLQASANQPYERLIDEDEAGRRPPTQIVSFMSELENRENSTKIVYSTLHPAFEQVILYFRQNATEFNLSSFIKELTPALGNYPRFFEWTKLQYNIPANLIPALYEAVMAETQLNPSHKRHSPSKSNSLSATGLLKKAAKAPAAERQRIRSKIDLAYSITLRKLDKQLLSENSTGSDQENMDLSYRRAKLHYHYALTFDNDSEYRTLLLRKAQEDFNKIQQEKQDKVKIYRRLIAQSLLPQY